MFEALGTTDLTAEQTADALTGARLSLLRVGAQRLSLAAHWADLHGPDGAETRARARRGAVTEVRAFERFTRPGADGTPEVSIFAAPELACYLGITETTAANLIRDALDLRHRHPRLWAAATTGEVEDWRARQVARLTREAELTLAQARWVDEETVDALTGLPFGRAMVVVEAKVIAADPARAEARRLEAEQRRFVALGRSDSHGQRTLVARTAAGDLARLDAMVAHVADLLGAHDSRSLDVRRAAALAVLADPARACRLLAGADQAEPSESAVEAATAFGRVLEEQGEGSLEQLRPRSVLYVHVSGEAVAGVDVPGDGVARVEGVGPLTLAQVREWLGHDRVVVRPVLDLAGQTPVDAYEIPVRHREAVLARHPFEVFPYGTASSRRCDLDHSTRFVPRADGGPPGQTHPDNLGPLSRRMHRLKTFGGWQHCQPLPGLYLWRTPTGHWFRVDHGGTHALGKETPEILRQQERASSVESRLLDLVWSP